MLDKINGNISRLKSSENPLSADVYFVYGKEYTYIIDVGANEQALELVSDTQNKKIIITHFHQDHMGNLKRLDIQPENLFVGSYTRKYLGTGTLVDSLLEINDGVKLTISPMPSTHAKGSLCVVINDEFLFLGDSYYGNSEGYNVSLLYDEINTLKKLTYKYVIMSHDEKLYSREEVESTLNLYYSKREKNKTVISYKRVEDD